MPLTPAQETALQGARTAERSAEQVMKRERAAHLRQARVVSKTQEAWRAAKARRVALEIKFKVTESS